MPRTGRPPIPLETKRLRGTLRADRTLPHDITAIAPVVIVPSKLGDERTGVEMLQRILDDGASTWIGPTDMAMAEAFVRLWDDAANLRAKLARRFNRDTWNAYRDATKGYISCLSALGLDPSARGRLGVAEVRKQSKLEELRERRESRAGRLAGSPQSRQRTSPEVTEATS